MVWTLLRDALARFEVCLSRVSDRLRFCFCFIYSLENATRDSQRVMWVA